MSHGFPLSLPSLTSSFVDWIEDDEYFPISTELSGLCEAVIGMYYTIKCSCQPTWKDPITGLSKRKLIQLNQEMVKDGFFKMAYIPCYAAKTGYTLATKTIQVCRRDTLRGWGRSVE